MEETSYSKSGSILDRITFSVFLVLAFLMPVFFIPASFISVQFGSSLLFGFVVIVCVIAYMLSGLISGSVSLPVPAKYLVGSMAVVPCIYVFAGIANGFSRMSFLGYTFDTGTVGFIVAGFFYMFLISVSFRDKRRLIYSYVAMAGSTVILFLFLAARLVFGAKFLSFGIFNSITSTVLDSWNNVGIYFGAAVIVLTLAMDGFVTSKKKRIAVAAALFLALFFSLLAGFTYLWVTIAACCFLFVLYKMFSPDGSSYGMHISSLSLKQKFSRLPMFSTIVFLVMVALAVFGASLNTSLSNALKISNIEVRPSMTVTLDIARNTLMSRPLFGSGPNTFVTQWLSFKPDDIVSTIFWNTDFSTGIGLIPTLVVTTGLMGLISWILFIGFFVYLGFSSIFARIDDHFLRFSLLSSFFSSVFLWTMTFLYVPGVVVLVLTFFVTGLFFASVFAAGIVPISPKIFSYSPRVGFIASIVMVAAVLGFIALGYGLFRNSQSLWLYQKSFQALNAGNLQEAEDYMGKAINTVPQDIYYRGLSEIEIYKMSAIIQQDPKKVDPVEIQKQFSAALSTGIKSGMSATNADSSNYLNWISLARVYESVSDPALKINGAYESAATAYGEALRRNPKNPGIFVLLSRLAFTRQDMTAAQNYALQAIQLKRNYTDAYFLLAQIQVAQKDIKSAIESVTAATVIDPTNSGSFFQLGLLKFSSGDYNGAIDAFNKAINLTPNYANAQYYLGLAYEITGNHQKAIDIFTALSQTNPDSVEVANILSSLKAGKSLFGSNQQAPVSKKAVKPPIKESAQ